MMKGLGEFGLDRTECEWVGTGGARQWVILVFFCLRGIFLRQTALCDQYEDGKAT